MIAQKTTHGLIKELANADAQDPKMIALERCQLSMKQSVNAFVIKTKLLALQICHTSMSNLADVSAQYLLNHAQKASQYLMNQTANANV